MTSRPTEHPHARCRHPECKADMFFVLTEKGRRMPIDADSALCEFDDGTGHGKCDHPFQAHDQGVCCMDGCGEHTFELADDYDPRRHNSHFTPYDAEKAPWGCKDPGMFRKRAKGGNSKRRAPKGQR